MRIRVWISNFIHEKGESIFHNFNGRNKPPRGWGHEWVIRTTEKHRCNYISMSLSKLLYVSKRVPRIRELSIAWKMCLPCSRIWSNVVSTLLPLVTHIHVNEVRHHWFIVACFVPSHCLNQWWLTVNWTPESKFQRNFNRHSYVFIQKNPFGNAVCKIAAILSLPQCRNIFMWLQKLIIISSVN